MFEIGQKVVCVDTNFIREDRTPTPIGLKPGLHECAVISEIWQHPQYGLLISMAKFNSDWFAASHFRPLESFPNFAHSETLETIESQPQTETV